MRICILASQYPLPTETFVYESVRWLEAAGHDVRVVTDRRAGGPGLAEADYPATVPPARFAPREKLRRVLAHPIRVLAGASRARRLTASGTFSFAESLTRGTLPEIRRSDFVVAHFGPAGARWLPAVAAARRRYAVFYHGFDASRHLQEHPHAYDGLIASRTAALTNSDFLKNRLVAVGFDPARVAIVPYGVSDALDGRVARPPERGGQVLSIARLVAKKGLDDSIRAFARAQDVLQGGWRYRIVGEGHLLGELQALAAALGVERLVEFSGTLPRGETLRALEGASVFLLTSKTGEAGDTEGTPVSILEAATLGLPIVTTIHAGIPELLPSNSARGMMLRPEGDVEGIATALRALARDPDLRRAWGGACRDFVRAGHSAQAHVAALLAALEQFAEAPR